MSAIAKMVRTRGTNGGAGKDREDFAAPAAGIEQQEPDGAERVDEGDELSTGGGDLPMYIGMADASVGSDSNAASPRANSFGHRTRSQTAAAVTAAATGMTVMHALGGNPPGTGGVMPPRFPPFRESYNDMTELRRELKVLSVQLNVPYYMHHSSPQRLEARCPSWKTRKEVPTMCEFVVAANRHTNGRVYVTRANVSHAMTCTAVQTNSSYVSAAALMETAKPFMQKMAETVKPRDMANIMKEKFGVSASYMTAWRALTAFKQEKKQEESASFMKIQGYLQTLATSNEGTAIAFEHLPNSNIFARAFLCPRPVQSAIRYCRPQLLLSAFLITSTYGGIMMTATMQDAMGDNVPVAIGIALNESDSNWRFFLEKLQEAIPELEQSITTFVHSRGDDLRLVLTTMFPKCDQSSAVDTFVASPSTATSGVTSTNNALQWLEALCSKSPLMILVGWVSKVASLLFQRYDRYGKSTSEYPDEYHALLIQYEAESEHYEVLRIAEHGYEVIDQQSGRQRIVDFAKQTCTCGEYGLVRADVIPHIYLMSSLKSLYAGRITPIDVDTVVSDNCTIPHPVPKTRGRPRKVQQIQQFADTKHEKLACSICGVKGHNKRTCKRSIVVGNSATTSLPVAVTADDPGFLEASYEDDTLHDIAAIGTSHDADSSPTSKRRRLGAKADSESLATESTVV